ncbi:Cysteine synthase B [Candidatus Sulfotelmatomonas gaucii]|uniref:Cysteine synthase B n=1 Tax=Candidatus Sulfuritelmatomonas gaucii TaxID=2043161 RepID=A0A2N9LQG0_9BACT|nr:Cysteine synthase B [Candidatus Sulfotelmatomonas gaucii]
MNHQTRVYENVFEMMPDEDNPTPLVRVNRLNPNADFPLYAKLEWMNPFGSVKDRAAWFLLRDLEERGELSDGRGLVEPTSGNTGISLAGMARARGHHMLAIVPNKVPFEKKVLLKIAGADLDIVSDELCPAPGLGDGSINLAKTYAKAQGHKYVMPNQYENPKNVEAHLKTTGPEIWKQTGGRVTHLFTSLGTCGTVTGIGQYLREKNPKIKIIAVQPTEGHDVPGLRNVSQLSVSRLFDPSLVDEILEIDFNHAYTRALELCQNEGLMAGPSSGLILEGALQIAARDKSGFGVMIFPDNIFKYTSNMIKHIPELKPQDAKVEIP